MDHSIDHYLTMIIHTVGNKASTSNVSYPTGKGNIDIAWRIILKGQFYVR